MEKVKLTLVAVVKGASVTLWTYAGGAVIKVQDLCDGETLTDGPFYPEEYVDHLENELARVKREVTRLNEAYANLKRAANEQITELQSELAKLQQENASYSKQMFAETQRARTAETERNKARLEADRRGQEVTRLRLQLSTPAAGGDFGDATRYRQTLADLGCCPSCLQVGEMDEEGPHSHCRCGTSEDYARRPLQSYQMLVRSARELITSVINNHGKVPIAEWSNFVEKVSKSEANHD